MNKMWSNSPSNVRTGYRQNFFYKVEWDGMLDIFIKIFVKNGNNWSMKKDLFDSLIIEKKIDQYHSFVFVRDRVLEIEGDTICFNEYIAESLLARNWRWSARNMFKNLKHATIVQIFIDAWAFIVDPEARAVSEFKCSNGNAMSVRSARKAGLIK